MSDLLLPLFSTDHLPHEGAGGGESGSGSGSAGAGGAAVGIRGLLEKQARPYTVR